MNQSEDRLENKARGLERKLNPRPPVNPVASWPYMAVLYIVQATVCKNTWFLLPTTFTFRYSMIRSIEYLIF